MEKFSLEMIKEIFSDKKRRAKVMLVFYLIFFIIVVVIMRGNQSRSYSDPKSKVPSSVEEEKVLDDFSFFDLYRDKNLYYSEIETVIDGNDIRFSMQLDQGIETINGFEHVYYIEDEQVYYLMNDMRIVPDTKYVRLRKLRPSYMVNLVDKDQFVSKTEYADGSVLYVYEVSSSAFYDVMGGEATYQNIQIQFLVMDQEVLSVHLVLDDDYITITYSDGGVEADDPSLELDDVEI